MANELMVVPMSDLKLMATAIAESGLFGMKTWQQAMALMLIAQAEGRHPATAARDYDIIQGRQSKKAEAMLRDFLAAGGKVEWLELTDARASAIFSHPMGGTAPVDWDLARAKKAGLEGKDNWKKYTRAMLRSRVVSEGCRTVYPAATSGMYTPEEVKDFDPVKGARAQPAKDMGAVELAQPEPATAPSRALLDTAEEAAARGLEAYQAFWNALSKADKKIINGEHENLKRIAREIDDHAQEKADVDVPY